MRFTPKSEYNEGKLFCEYEQLDLEGNPLYVENEQHLQLNVIYLSDPFIEQKDIGEVEVNGVCMSYQKQFLFLSLGVGRVRQRELIDNRFFPLSAVVCPAWLRARTSLS